MKRIDVIIAGLVIVGVFGLVFAGQTFTLAKLSPQSGDVVAVGAACPWYIRYAEIDAPECYMAGKDCIPVYNTLGKIVDYVGQSRPKCSTPSFRGDPSSDEIGGVDGPLRDWDCPAVTVYQFDCYGESQVVLVNGRPTEVVFPKLKSTATPFNCPSGTFQSYSGC